MIIFQIIIDQNVGLDFEVTGLGNYQNITHADIKTPISLEDFASRGVKVFGPNTYENMGTSMGTKLIKQKARFCNVEGGPAGPENVLHLIDLRKIWTYYNKSTIIRYVLDAAEMAGNSNENIIFVNFDT